MAYGLKIEGFDVKLHPCTIKDVKYSDCDSEGNKVKKKVIQKSESEWRNEAGEVVTETYKLNPKNNKPMTKLSRTAEVTRTENVPKDTLKDVIPEGHYIVQTENADLLRQKLKDGMLKFLFTSGGGFKVYKALLHEENGKFWLTTYRKTKTEFAERYDELCNTADFEDIMGKGIPDAQPELNDLI